MMEVVLHCLMNNVKIFKLKKVQYKLSQNSKVEVFLNNLILNLINSKINQQEKK